MAELRKWGFFPRGSEMPWSRTFSPVVHVSLWDFLLAYSFTPVSGLCRSSFSLWLLIRHVTRPDCHPKVNWRICARDPLIMANLLGFTLPTVTVHRNTTIPSTTQKGSSKTKCGVSQSGWWGVTANLPHWTLPPSHTSHTFRRGRIEGREPRQVPLISLRSEVTLLMSTCPEETIPLQPLWFGLYNAELHSFHPARFSRGLPEETTNQPLCTLLLHLGTQVSVLLNTCRARRAPLNYSELIFVN